MLAHNHDACYATMRGQAYEAYIHRNFDRLLSGQKLKAFLLDPNGFVKETHIKIPKFSSSSHFTNLGLLLDKVYGIPDSRSYSAVDAVCKPCWAFQMTVSKDHGLVIEGLQKVKEGLGLRAGDPLYVVMVCPPDVAHLVRWQPLLRSKKIVKAPRGLKPGEGLLQYCVSIEWAVEC